MPLFVDIRRGGASSQTEIGEEENSSENDQNSGESDKNVDNSGDLSTSDGSSKSGASVSENNANSTDAEGGSEVKANSANDLGVYDDDGVTYWISDTSYYSSSWSGSGTASSPYLIQSAEDLALLSYLVFTGNSQYGLYFEQTCDIDLSEYYWMPIGRHCSDGCDVTYAFAGDYDGGGYKVTGITTYYGGEYDMYGWMGLFGFVYNLEDFGYTEFWASVHDIRVEDSTIKGYEYCGGIAGDSANTIFYNCYNSATIIATRTGSSWAGGIVGSAYIITKVYNCYNSGTVQGGRYVGGVIGCTDNTTVYCCYNTGSLSGGDYVGGIAGSATREVTVSSSGCYFYNCFNIGDVTATSEYVGGIFGATGYYCSHLTVSNCYYGNCTITGIDSEGDDVTYQKGIGYDNATSAEGVDEEGVCEYLEGIAYLAKTESWFVTSANWNSDYSWDFLWTWKIDASQNDGYPILESSVCYDSDGGFWYFEDGYMPQSYYGEDVPSDVDTSEVLSSYVVRLSSASLAQVMVYGGTANDYAYVTYVGSSTSVSAWFVMEPVVWIVAYGSEMPTTCSNAVSAKVVTCGYVSATSAGLGWSWAMSSVLGMSVETLEYALDLTKATTGSFAYDSFASSLSQTVVEGDSLSLSSKIAVASVDEIDALGGAYATKCTDFVAFLMSGGSSTSSSSTTAYWTRDLACELTSDSTYGRAFSYDGTYNQGVYVTSDGVLSNATLKNCMGARLSVSV